MSNKHKINSDIVIGEGVVPWHNDFADDEKLFIEKDYNPGWVLPGGEITLDKRLAITVATNIDRRIQAAKPENDPITI